MRASMLCVAVELTKAIPKACQSTDFKLKRITKACHSTKYKVEDESITPFGGELKHARTRACHNIYIYRLVIEVSLLQVR